MAGSIVKLVLVVGYLFVALKEEALLISNEHPEQHRVSHQKSWYTWIENNCKEAILWWFELAILKSTSPCWTLNCTVVRLIWIIIDEYPNTYRPRVIHSTTLGLLFCSVANNSVDPPVPSSFILHTYRRASHGGRLLFQVQAGPQTYLRQEMCRVLI